MNNPNDVIVHNTPISTRLVVLGQLCRVHATVIETVDLANGDSTEQISVDDIIIEGSGQTILPIALKPEQFRAIVKNIKAYIPE